MQKRNKNIDMCYLLPYEREDILSIQEIGQKPGWEITAFNLPAAWKYTQGENVKIAVLDTGCDLNHPDLKDNLLTGKNFCEPQKDPIDDNGHGSHITGILCAENNDIGVVGVAPKSKVMPIKVLDHKGAGKLSNVARGIIWATDQGIDFITMSLGSPNPVSEVHQAIKYANKKGVVIFCAAGNAGKTRTIFYPANYPETIGIGAIDENFDRANFSCTGDDLDFLAPGVKIFSTVPESWYAYLSGTSMANPFATGIAALVLSYKRKKNINLKLSTDDYKKILRSNTIPTNNPEFANKKFFEGFGIIDARKLSKWLHENHS